MRTTQLGAVGMLAVAVVLAACGSGSPKVGSVPSKSARVDLRYVIPAGTTARLERGEALHILPERLTVHVGEVIQIVNHDDHGQVLGPFYVDAASTMTQQFRSPGKLIGRCTVHLSGEIELDVRP